MNPQVLAQWTYPGNDETGFLLERSVDSGSTWPVQVGLPLTTQYTDTAVAVFGTYWYRVAASNPKGTGSFSNLANVFIVGPAFDIPQLTASVLSPNQQVYLNWHYTGSSFGNTDFFLLERSVDSGSTWPVSSSVTASNSSTIDSTVLYGGTYWYRITPHNDLGVYGTTSNTASAFLPPVPLGPSNLVVFSGSAILAWTGSSFANYYTVQRSVVSVGGYSEIATSVAATYTDTAPTSSFSGSTYWYRVAAVDIDGTSSFSNTASITFTYAPPFGSITLTAVSQSGYILVSSTSSILNAITFHYWRSLNGGSYSEIFVGPSASIHDSNVTSSLSGNLYTYFVNETNTYGTSSNSNTASVDLFLTASVSACHSPSYPAQLFTSSLDTNLTYDLV